MTDTSSNTALTNGAALTDLTFAPITTSAEPVEAQYTVDNAPTPLTSATNEVVINGVTIQLKAQGPVSFNAATQNAAVGVATDGLLGTDGTAIPYVGTVNAINVTGTAFVLNTTGGAAGQVGIGGTGGIGGAGGNATTGTIPRLNVLIFPPMVIPDTDKMEIAGAVGGKGAQGGTGGSGQLGGTVGEIDFSITSATVAAVDGVLAQTTGGLGGIGGQGGFGGRGGQGAMLMPRCNLQISCHLRPRPLAIRAVWAVLADLAAQAA